MLQVIEDIKEEEVGVVLGKTGDQDFKIGALVGAKSHILYGIRIHSAFDTKKDIMFSDIENIEKSIERMKQWK